MFQSTKSKSARMTGISAIGLFAATNVATAQSTISSTGADSTAATASSLEEIVITGTRVAREGFDAPTPTTVVGSEMLIDRAPSVLIDALKLLPASRGTSTPTTAGQAATGAGGASFVNLRGLGPNRTLVLLNGQRIVPTTSVGTVDIALLPQALVNRAEIVTGGASAAYGSDAVAGVVGLVLDTRFEGFKSDFQAGLASHGDADSQKASLTWGGDLGERWHLVASAEYYQSDGLDPFARDFASFPTGIVNNPAFTPTNGEKPLLLAPFNYAPNVTFGGVVVGGPLANTQFLPGGATAPLTPCSPQTSSYQLCSSRRDDVPWNANMVFLASPQERGTAYSRLTFEVSPNIELYADGLYGESQTSFTSVPATTQLMGLMTIQRDNAFMPAEVRDQMTALGLTSFRLGRFSRDMGVGEFSRDAVVKRVSTGIDADLSGSWKLGAYAAYGESDLESLKQNATIAARFNESVDSVVSPTTGQPICRSTLTNPGNGCVPVNVFGEGSPSQAAQAYFEGTTVSSLETRQLAVGVNVSGTPFSTWAGPVSVAFGGEYRDEEAEQTVDPISLGFGWVSTNPQPLSGKIDVTEGYVETVVPLADDMFLAKNLELNAAARTTDYSTSGTVETWKVGANYSPFESIRFRATRSRDIRAPNILELNSPPVGVASGANVIDPRNNQPVLVQSWTSGNSALIPEESDTTSAGVVFQPTFLPGLSASLDYYDIRIEGAISTLSLQSILNGCEAGDAALCALVTRNSAGQLTRVTSAFLNVQQIATDGFDFEAEYGLNLEEVNSHWGGDLAFRVIGNYVKSYVVETGASRMDMAGDAGSLPEWGWDVSTRYSIGGSVFLVSGTYLGGGKFSVPSQDLIGNNNVKSVWYVNAMFEQQFNTGGKQFAGYISAQNLFDQEPPFGFGFAGGSYDRLGRYIKVGFRFEM